VASASDTQTSDGLVIPDKIPCDDLKPENIRAAAAALSTVASSYTTTAQNMEAAWAAMPASFVAPDAHIVYGGMSKPAESARTFSTKVDKVSHALRTYADSLGEVKKTLSAIKQDANAFLTEFEAGDRVWVNARETQAYEWDPKIRSGMASARFGTIGEDPVSYLQGRGETARSLGGDVQILVHWSQSGTHVSRNNELMNRIADAYARVNALEVECANAVNAQRDECVAPLKAVEAWQLKQDGENLAELPWGHRSDEQRNCSESFGHGVGTAFTETVQGLGGLIGYNPVKNQFWDGAHAGLTWLGFGQGLAALGLMVNPLGPVLGTLGVPGYKEAQNTVTEMGKGLVAWDTWGKNPAEASGAVLFNVGTLLIPGVDAVKAASVLSKVEVVAGAVAKVERLAARLEELFPKGRPPHVDVDAPESKINLHEKPASASTPQVHVDEPDTVRPPQEHVEEPVTGRDNPSTSSNGDGDDTGSGAGHPADHNPSHEKAQTQEGTDGHSPVQDDSGGVHDEGRFGEHGQIDPRVAERVPAPDVEFEPTQQFHDALEARNQAVEARQVALAQRASALDRLDELGIHIDPKDLTVSKIDDAIRSEQRAVRADSSLSRSEANMRIDELDELRDRALDERKSYVAQVKASEALGDAAARDAIRGQGADTIVDGKGAVSGEFDQIGLTHDQRTLIFAEAKGGSASLSTSGRLLPDGTRAAQGSTLYFNEILRNDQALRGYLIAHPEIGRGLADGTINVRYELVHAKANGTVTVEDLVLDPRKLDLSVGTKK